MLSHKQVLSVGERKFRWEYPEDSPLAVFVPAAAPGPDVKILVPVDKSPLPLITDGGEGMAAKEFCLIYCYLSFACVLVLPSIWFVL